MKKIIIAITFIVFIFGSDFNSFCQDDQFIIIYNNMAGETNLKSDWGFAAWIEIDEKIYLFDTGAKGDVLLSNLNELNFDLSKVEKVIISHNHYDHVGGLPAIADKLNPNIEVYLPEPLDEETSKQLKNLDLQIETNYKKIADRIWITEVMENPANRIKEHALVIEDSDKYIIITGCAHPGIISICESIKKYFPDKTPELVTGGFHLVSTSDSEVKNISGKLKSLGIEKAGASHCTGDEAVAIFREDWGEYYYQLFLGEKYVF